MLTYVDAWQDAIEQDEIGEWFDNTPENGPTVQDEAYYVESILSGEHDEQEAEYGDWAEADYDPDGWMVAQDRYDRSVYGD